MNNKMNFLKLGDLYKRFIFLIFSLIIYRLGSHIPVPGINLDQLKYLINRKSINVLYMLNMFSSGLLLHFTIFTLGVTPYISSSIFVQMLTVISSKFRSLKKEGIIGQKKISFYTRIFSVILAIIQAFGISIILKNQNGIIISSGFLFYLMTITTLVTGSVFLMWLGEQITERGLGNGISIIIFCGISSGLPNSINKLHNLMNFGLINKRDIICILFLIIIITLFVIFIEQGQRKIFINYVRRNIGNQPYDKQLSNLPLKINVSGVMPPIFASSFILFFSTFFNLLSRTTKCYFIKYFLSNIINILKPFNILYLFLYSLFIMLFCFFYTILIFNSKEISENLKKSGAFIIGIRPGYKTKKFIDGILMRLAFIGSIYMIIICTFPEFLIMYFKAPFYFGGTSLLIIVVVSIDLVSQIQSHIIKKQYKSLLKKVKNKKKNILY